MSKEIKRKIRDLNKCKRQCRVGTEERRIIVRQIRELKSKIEPIETDKEKEELIKQICEKDEWYKNHKSNLYKFTKEQLRNHICKTKK